VRADSRLAKDTLYFARDLSLKPHAHGPIAAPGLAEGLLLEEFANQPTCIATCS